MRETFHRCSAFVCVAGTVLLASCAGERREPVYAVGGKVLADGKPAEGALVMFHQVGADQKTAVKPSGRTGPDGTFRMSSYTANDGAPEGEYAVTIVWPTRPPPNRPDAEDGPDRLKGRLADPKTSKWRVKVEKKPLELEPFKID